MREAIEFYTRVLDFTLDPADSADESVVDLFNGDAVIQLTAIEGKFGVAVNVVVADVDRYFEKYVGRGLKVPNDPGSPVHNGPVDQTWGWREFYVNDPSGNTLRFREWIKVNALEPLDGESDG